MKVGVTGATGFLGRFLVGELIDRCHQVVAWHSHRSHVHHRGDVHWIDGRLGESDAAFDLASQCEALIHTALVRGDSFMDDPDDVCDYFRTNVIGSLQLIEASAKHAHRRFVFVSSGAVHEKALPGKSIDETHPLWPGSIYGAYKASVETLIHAYGIAGKLAACSLRPTSIYGVDDPIGNSKWYELVRQIVDGETVDVSGGSKAVHVGEVARAAAILLETDQAVSGETFACTDRLISNHEVAEIVKRICGSESSIVGQRKTGGNMIDTSKIQRLGMTFGEDGSLESTIAELVSRIDR